MIRGEVIRGDGVGKRLGYPTANLDVDIKKIKLSSGVYAARAFLGRKKYLAALIIQSELKKIELYLLDYGGGDFYGADLAVEPVEKVSEIVPFKTEKELVEKIKGDIKIVRGML